MSTKIQFAIACALAFASCHGALTVTASRDYVDRRTSLTPVTNDGAVVGFKVGIHTNDSETLASKSYVDNSTPGDYNAVSNAAMRARAKTDMVVYDTNGVSTVDRLATTGDVEVAIGRFRADLITDGTNTIDAAGNVYTNAVLYSSEWVVSQVEGYSFTGPYYSDGWIIEYEGGGGVISGALYTNGPPDAVELTFKEPEYALVVHATRPITGIVSVAYGKLALTNDIDYTTSNTQLVATIRAEAHPSDQITDGTNTINADRNVFYGKYADAWVEVKQDGTYANIFTNRAGTTEWYSIYKDDDYPEEQKGFVIYYSGTWQFSSSYSSPSDEEGPEDADSLMDGRFLRGDWPIPAGKLALTNDIPSEVAVVAPSTNAVAGTAADAKATGTALYTGFTEWDFHGFEPYTAVSFTYSNSVWTLKAKSEYDESISTYYGSGTEDSTNVIVMAGHEPICIASRHLVTPTKTSQLTNDGPSSGPNVGHPFATTNQITAPGNYSAVSNSAMNARNMTDMTAYDTVVTNSWKFFGPPEDIASKLSLKWDVQNEYWELRYDGEYVTTPGDGGEYTDSTTNMTFGAEIEDVQYMVTAILVPEREITASGGLVVTNVAGELFMYGTNIVPLVFGAAQRTEISATDPTFSNAVISVGLNIDTNTVAAINALVEQGDELPIGGATTVGVLILALAAAIAGLKRKKADKSDLDAKLDSTSAAQEWTYPVPYDAGAYVTYLGTLYECVVAHATTSSSDPPPDDLYNSSVTPATGHWKVTDMSTPDATFDIMANGFARLVGADGTLLWQQGYDLKGTTSSSPADGGVNAYAFAANATAEVSLVLPSVTSGKVGDFILDITNPALDSGASSYPSAFIDSSTYAVGDKVAYDSKIWRCTTAVSTAGAWTGSTNWELAYPYFSLPSTASYVTPRGVNISDILSFAPGTMCELYFTLTSFAIGGKPTWKVARQDVEAAS